MAGNKPRYVVLVPGADSLTFEEDCAAAIERGLLMSAAEVRMVLKPETIDTVVANPPSSLLRRGDGPIIIAFAAAAAHCFFLFKLSRRR